MPTLAEDFAYFLVNPSNPYFAEEDKLFRFWGLDHMIELLAQANLLGHADIVALGSGQRNAASIWSLIKDDTFYGITFREYANISPSDAAEKLYCAVK